MAMNIAQRRAKKAARRKTALAGKRKVESSGNTILAQVQRAAGGPILHCKMHESLFEDGIGTLIVVRGAPGETVLCGFLLDVFCLGIKDVEVRSVTMSEVDLFLDVHEEAAPMKSVEPAYARKLLHDLASWAEAIGFSPSRDYAVAVRVFGDSNPDACNAAFSFGHNGKPRYMPGPSETPSDVRRRVERLQQRLGRDGFELVLDEELLSAAKDMTETLLLEDAAKDIASPEASPPRPA